MLSFLTQDNPFVGSWAGQSHNIFTLQRHHYKGKMSEIFVTDNQKNIFKKLVFEDCLVGTDLRLKIFYKKSMKKYI